MPRPETDETSFGPKELVAVVVGNWILLLVCVLAGLLVVAAYLYITKPLFKAESIVLFETKSNELVLAYGAVGGGLGGGVGQTQAELAIIQSQIVLGRVVQDLKNDLVVTPKYYPVVGEALARHDSWLGQVASGVPGLRRYVWQGKTSVEIPTFEVPPQFEGRAFTVFALGNKKYNLLLGEKVLLLNAGVGQSYSAALDATTNAQLRIFVAELEAAEGAHFDVKRLRASAAIDALKSAVTVTEAAPNSGVIRINAIAVSGAKAAKLANGVANAYLRQNVERRSAEAARTLAFLKTQLPGVRRNVEEAEGALNAYRLRNGSVDMAKETELILTESTQVEQKLNEIQQKRAELLLTLTPVHPQIKALDLTQSRVADQAARIQKSIAKLPSTQQELLSLRREVEVNTGLYTTMLNNMQQLEVAEAGTLGNVRIIDEASAPGAPFKPNTLITVVGGLIAGLAGGLLILMVRTLLDTAEHDPGVIERITGVPVYATVPYSRVQSRLFDDRNRNKSAVANAEQLLVISEPRDPASESIRSLRTTLHFSVFESQHKSIMFTGPTPGIGKSFVTANLATLLAQVPMKIILVDADLRRGTVHDYFRLSRAKGVSDYVLGTDMKDVIQESGVNGLKIISTGAVPPNPSELLMSPRFAQLLAEAEALADLVLVDCGPVLAVTDASIIGRVTGATLLVLKAGQHTRREIQETVKRLFQVGVRVRGLVLNQVGRGTGYGNYGYGKYGYYYAYGYKTKKE